MKEDKENISFSWYDEASREIFSKYLNPFEDNCTTIEDNYHNQVHKLHNINDSVDDLEEKILKITTLCETISRSLEKCSSFRDVSQAYLIKCTERNSEAKEFLNQANALFLQIRKMISTHEKKRR